ncbi:CHAD domain containing protein [Richelia sinica FACHB-800]|uniref:CHAD domain containing protein n=1 Tax=Richelia sinica FACHB-800 TaxID=1357546 RepID=A0A975TBW0_9NOST|nr:CHAD domain-containing protein [Richelia sinica]MBD2667160.1 CHAD domain-containing protein [Richelia sinica FACHB-800]QXE25610.1 CHAD domain containing protein [Richelia sinica FACHB-800]
MQIANKTQIKTLGDCAYAAIEKHFHKSIKWEKSVKKDEDPEALHQMRVGMRRLRTAVSRFGLCVNLPKLVSDKNIGKISRILGNLRDLDVLKSALENNYQPHLPPKEQALLKSVFSALAQQREIEVHHVKKLLKDETYKTFKKSCQEWLDQPIYHPLAALPIQEVLPDLLLPEISKFFLHPGWLIGTQFIEEKYIQTIDWTPEELDQKLIHQGEVLHNLRKQAKRVRYQMELFTNLYGEEFASQVGEVKNIQTVLGDLQDSVVLHECLKSILKSEINTEMRGMTTLLSAQNYQIWQQWQLIQAHYLKPEVRHNFHYTILQPKETQQLAN